MRYISLVPPRGLVTVLLAAVMSLAPVCATSGGLAETRTASYALTPDAMVEIGVDAADIYVHRSGSSDVEVTATLRNFERINYSVVPSSAPPTDRLSVTVAIRPEHRARAWVTLDVAVPDDARLRIEAGRGDITVTGPLSGDATLNTGQGAVRVGRVTSFYTIATGRGDITVDGLMGGLDARSEVGGITVNAAFAPGRTSRIRTGYGDVDIVLSEASDLRVTGSTESGRVDASGIDGAEVAGRRVKARLGHGTAALDIALRNGSIKLRKGS